MDRGTQGDATPSFDVASAPLTDDDLSAPGLVAPMLGLGVDSLLAGWTSLSFIDLGGSSLMAVGLASVLQRRLGVDVDIGRLMSGEPLATVVSDAPPAVMLVRPTRARDDTALRPLLPGQAAMLAAHVAGHDQTYRLMFSMDVPGTVSVERLERAARRLGARHESLRTAFTLEHRLVLPVSTRLHVERLDLPGSPCDEDALHLLLRPRAEALLRPLNGPPVAFVITRSANRTWITLMVHHIVVDGWSIGLLLGELARGAGHESLDEGIGPSPELVAMHNAQRLSGTLHSKRAASTIDSLRGIPTTLRLPSDAVPGLETDGCGHRLLLEVPEGLSQAVEQRSSDLGVTRTAVLLAAWALALSRRTGSEDLVIGVPVSGRGSADLYEVVALCTTVVPVVIQLSDVESCSELVHAAAAELSRAAGPTLCFEESVQALGAESQGSQNPLAQIGFAAHDDIVPSVIATPDGEWTVTEGHGGGSVFDVLLYIQSWGERPRLALEHATNLVTPTDAAELGAAFIASLTSMVDDADVLVDLAPAPDAERRRVVQEMGAGGAYFTEDDVWSRIALRAAEDPAGVAVRDVATGVEVAYEQLIAWVEAQAGRLWAAGVRPGDRVVIDVPRSLQEVVAVLGTLRLGAAYVALDTNALDASRRTVATRSRATAVIVGDRDAAFWGPVPAVPALGPIDDIDSVPVQQHQVDPDAAVYVCFTSGTTGTAKGVVVPGRAVLRLVDDPDLMVSVPRMRMLRMAPLAFDASTLELLVPLARGQTVVVAPPGTSSAAGIERVLTDHEITHAWLTAGLFHQVADHNPAAFSHLTQLLTGGGVVSSVHVRTVLEESPGLRVTNGYGPTENTTFTSVHHLDLPGAVGDSVPIGRAVLGTDLFVLDSRGELSPRGAVGELVVAGAGLALGYLDDPRRTNEAFVYSTSVGRSVYRTGDLVRWRDDGSLAFHGRGDRQVKIAGHRVELGNVDDLIRAQPGIQDAAVFLSEWSAAVPQLCAAVKAEPDVNLDALRHAMTRLPSYAVPGRWLVVEAIPLDPNGKVDQRRLEEMLDGTHHALPSFATAPPDTTPAESVIQHDLEDAVVAAWATALGTDDFDDDEAFFDVGGDSLRLAVLRTNLENVLGVRLALTDLYQYPTVRSLAGYLAMLDPEPSE